MAMEFRRIGPNEVRITRVYTKEMDQFGGDHDPTPNWHTGRTPAVGGVGVPPAFHLTIEAEAGSAIGGGTRGYNVYVQAACLTNPLAAVPPFGLGNMGSATAPMFGAAFNTDSWEFQPDTERYTITWDRNFPAPAALALGGGGWGLERNQVWQFFVTLVDTAASPTFACTAVSEPFFLL
jgi:hypothetical protein